MTRHVIVAIGLLALATSGNAEEPYTYQDDGSAAWSEPPPPDDDGRPRVDVDVDLGTADARVSVSTFEQGLAPYGEWVSSPSYGRVWRPLRVSAGWRPYYFGRWEWTDEGWLWVSDEPWGWATYHYGRWAYEPYRGWLWVPGYQWAPAWVSWRYSSDYVGWAPLAPGLSVYVTSPSLDHLWWSFVPCGRFVGFPVASYAYTGGHVRGIYHATQPAPPRARVFGVVAPAWGGPARPFLEHRVGRPIAPVRVVPVASVGQLHGRPAGVGIVPIYRPELRMRAPAAHPVMSVPQQHEPPGTGARPHMTGPAFAAPAPHAGNPPSGRPLGVAPVPASSRTAPFPPAMSAHPARPISPPSERAFVAPPPGRSAAPQGGFARPAHAAQQHDAAVGRPEHGEPRRGWGAPPSAGRAMPSASRPPAPSGQVAAPAPAPARPLAQGGPQQAPAARPSSPAAGQHAVPSGAQAAGGQRPRHAPDHRRD